MDKLRLSLTGDDFTRLYNWNRGFVALDESIAFPDTQSLTMFLISLREYEFSVTGDATVKKVDDIHSLEGFNMQSVDWTDEARKRGSGSAVVTMTNPDAPDQPNVFTLTMGEFKHTSTTPPQASDTADGGIATNPLAQDGIRTMLMQEAAHAMFSPRMGPYIDVMPGDA